MAAAEPLTGEERLIKLMADCRYDPEMFVRWAFPWTDPGELEHEAGPREWQVTVLRDIKAALLAGGDVQGAIRIAVASGHGIGKSALVSWVILWALSTMPLTRVVITANTGDQLRTKTWPEVSKWFNLCLTRHWFKFEATSIARRSSAGSKEWRCDAATWSENNTAAFAGLHNKGRRIVLLFDEASQIADRVWEVAEGAMTDEDTEILWLAFGNPTETTGRFRECFAGGRFAHRWHPRQIDSRQVPGTNKAEIAKWVADWGEDSDFVRVRVKGEFPRGGSMQFIDSDTAQAATLRPVAASVRQPLIIGVDVARFGEDQTVIWFRRGPDARMIPPIKLRGADTVAVASRVTEQAIEHNAQAIFVDETGVGAGVVDMLRGMLRDRVVVGVNNGGKADRYLHSSDMPATANKGAEMWASMREWLKTGGVPRDSELVAELCGRQYGFNPKSEIQLERKEDMKKRGLASPDCADALALTFAYPVADLPETSPVELFAPTPGRPVHGLISDYDPLAG